MERSARFVAALVLPNGSELWPIIRLSVMAIRSTIKCLSLCVAMTVSGACSAQQREGSFDREVSNPSGSGAVGTTPSTPTTVGAVPSTTIATTSSTVSQALVTYPVGDIENPVQFERVHQIGFQDPTQISLVVAVIGSLQPVVEELKEDSGLFYEEPPEGSTYAAVTLRVGWSSYEDSKSLPNLASFSLVDGDSREAFPSCRAELLTIPDDMKNDLEGVELGKARDFRFCARVPLSALDTPPLLEVQPLRGSTKTYFATTDNAEAVTYLDDGSDGSEVEPAAKQLVFALAANSSEVFALYLQLSNGLRDLPEVAEPQIVSGYVTDSDESDTRMYETEFLLDIAVRSEDGFDRRAVASAAVEYLVTRDWTENLPNALFESPVGLWLNVVDEGLVILSGSLMMAVASGELSAEEAILLASDGSF